MATDIDSGAASVKKKMATYGRHRNILGKEPPSSATSRLAQDMTVDAPSRSGLPTNTILRGAQRKAAINGSASASQSKANASIYDFDSEPETTTTTSKQPQKPVRRKSPSPQTKAPVTARKEKPVAPNWGHDSDKTMAVSKPLPKLVKRKPSPPPPAVASTMRKEASIWDIDSDSEMVALSAEPVKADKRKPRQKSPEKQPQKPVRGRSPQRPSNYVAITQKGKPVASVWDMGSDSEMTAVSQETPKAVKRKPNQTAPEKRDPKRQKSSSPDPSRRRAPPLSTQNRASHSRKLSAVSIATSSKSAMISKSPNKTQNTLEPTERFNRPDAPKPRSPPRLSKSQSTSTSSNQRDLAIRASSRPQPSGRTVLDRPMPTSSKSLSDQQRPQIAPRRRLVDALVAQAQDSSDEDDNDVLESPYHSQQKDVAIGKTSQSFPSSPASSSQSQIQSQAPAFPTPAPLISRRPGLKYTYSQDQRSMLASDPFAPVASTSNSIWMSQSLFPGDDSQQSNFAAEDDDMDDSTKPAVIHSIHEMRRAGASARFTDELHDIMDRVGQPSNGKPSSIRRTALLELANKVLDKGFRQQFRDHSDDSTLAKNLGSEHDVISGFIVLCILVTLLAHSAPVHLIHQLEQSGIAELLARFLTVDTDIAAIAEERSANLSSYGRKSLIELKSAVLRLDIWRPAKKGPETLSPQLLGLKCLALMLQNVDPSTESSFITQDVAEKLFGVLSTCMEAEDEAAWDFPNTPESTTFYPALFLLEFHSGAARESNAVDCWSPHNLRNVAEVLETSLRRSTSSFRELEVTALKLTLNCANNNPNAAELFVGRGVLRDLADVAHKAFEALVASNGGDNFPSGDLDTLLLVMGIMINLAEHDQTAGRALINQGGMDALLKLMGLFLTHRSAAAEADSVEVSHTIVAYGYLGVLLGYLCLYPPIRKDFASLHPEGNIRPLLASIEEFIIFNKAAEGGVESSHSTGTLQRLLHALAEAA